MPILQRLIELYKLWQQYLVHFPTTSRHTLGARIDTLLIEIAEALFSGSFLTGYQKLTLIERASVKLDSVKFLLRLAWEIKALHEKRYILLSTYLDKIGKMLGGWLKQLKQNSPKQSLEQPLGQFSEQLLIQASQTNSPAPSFTKTPAEPQVEPKEELELIIKISNSEGPESSFAHPGNPSPALSCLSSASHESESPEDYTLATSALPQPAHEKSEASVSKESSEQDHTNPETSEPAILPVTVVLSKTETIVIPVIHLVYPKKKKPLETEV